MRRETEARLEKVKRYGVALRRLSKFIFAVTLLLGAAVILVFAFGGGENTTISIGVIKYRGDTMPLAARLAGIGGALLYFGILLKLLVHLIKLFDLYAHGRIFTTGNIAQIRRIGIAVFMLLVPWVYGLIVQIMALNVAPSETRFSMTISSGILFGPLFGPLVVGTIIMFFSWIMDVGRELREEQDLVV